MVGAIALALLAVVVLPMVFDPQPRPLGNNVDIRIPGQDTPFQQVPGTPLAPAPSSAGAQTPQAAMPQTPPAAAPAQAPVAVKPETKPEPKPEAKAAPEPESKHVAKPEPKHVAKPAAKPEPKVQAKPKKAEPAAPAEKAKPAAVTKTAAESGYSLQLGVFSSKSNAEQMVAKARKAGFKSSILPVGKQYKVRIGPIADRAKALDYEAKLKAKGLVAVLVEP